MASNQMGGSGLTGVDCTALACRRAKAITSASCDEHSILFDGCQGELVPRMEEGSIEFPHAGQAPPVIGHWPLLPNVTGRLSW